MNSVNLERIYELIDTYKYTSVAGERVEIIVTPYGEDNSKRVITIGLQGGFSRDRKSFVVDNGQEFDEIVLPKILSYYSHDDALGEWNLVDTEAPATRKGSIETESGNILYLETYDDTLFDEVTRRAQEVEEVTSYKKEKLTDSEKIWNEIIRYVKVRRIAQDFYIRTNFTPEERQFIYYYIVNLSNEKAISISDDKVSREKNDKFIEELFKNQDKLIESGLTKELIDKIISGDELKNLSRLVSAEKRIRRKVDFSNPEIISKINFAIAELGKTDFFELRNASAVKYENGLFDSSQPKLVKSLQEQVNSNLSIEPAKKQEFNEHCVSLLGYLEKKAQLSKKIVSTNAKQDNVTFIENNDAIVDSYDEFKETLDIVLNARRAEEKYEIVIEPDPADATRRKVRISVVDGVSRNDTFNFLFTDGKLFDERFDLMLEEIRKNDPNFQTVINYSKTPDGREVTTYLHESKNRNEVLLKDVPGPITGPHTGVNFTKSIEDVQQQPVQEAKPENVVEPPEVESEPDREKNEQTQIDRNKFIEQQILEVAERQDALERANQQPTGEIVSFDKMHEYVSTFKINNNTGELEINYINGGKYEPVSEEERRNIEFAIFWLVCAGVEDSKDDVVIGEKFAFSEENRQLFEIMSCHIKAAITKGIEIDWEQLKDDFMKSGIPRAEMIYDRIFHSQIYEKYITEFYQKALGLYKPQGEEIKEEPEKAVEPVKPVEESKPSFEADETMKKAGREQAGEIVQKATLQEIKEGAQEEAQRIVLGEAGKEQAQMLYERIIRDLYAIAGKKQAEQIIQNAIIEEIKSSAEEVAKKIVFGEAGRKQAEALVRKAVFDEIEREKLIKAGEIQAEQLFWRDAGKEQAQLMIDQKPLFDVVEGQQIPEDIQELVNYYASLEDAQKAKDPESAAKSAPIIKICFDDKKPDTVEVSISESESDENGYAVSEKVYIQKSFTIDRAKREVIPTLCKKFIENGEIESNICHSARNNETLIRAEGKYDLSVIGTLQKTLQFTNIDEEVLGLVEELLNIKVSRHDFEVPGLGIKTL